VVKRITGLNTISEPIKSNTAGDSVTVVALLEVLLPPLQPEKAKKENIRRKRINLCLALITFNKAIRV
jgi:hypothetical protein